MGSLLFALLIWTNVTAQNADLEFITGFRQRPVRIVVDVPAQTTPAFGSDRAMIRRALNHVEALKRLSGSSSDLTVGIENWTDLFALGHVLALANDPEWELTADHPALSSMKGLFEIVAPPGAGEANQMARWAVKPFRSNWLYSSSFAVALNQIEHVLAEGWRKNLAFRLLEEFGSLFSPQPSTSPLRPAIPKFLWTGNEAGRSREQVEEMMASSIPPHVMDQINVPLLFEPISNDVRLKIERRREACREDLGASDESSTKP